MQNYRPGWVVVVTVLWVSFLFAGVATMLFFATFDPELIASFAAIPMDLDRMSGYSYGFLLFWALLAVNGGVLTWLLNLPVKQKKR